MIMRKPSIAAFVALSALSFPVAARAAAPFGAPGADGGRVHDIKHPLGAEQRERRRIALRESIRTGQSARVMEVGDGRYVELEQARRDRVFMLLVEFGDQQDAAFPAVFTGPSHNQIAEPDRVVDNTTIWQPDFNRAHFGGILEQMNEYYGWQSSGRYALEGEVTEWVKVAYNEARYGSNLGTNRNAWMLITEALAQWVEDRCAAGTSIEQLREELATFDVWDRYDYDLDGNFDEPDGYIDHFLVVHAGEGEETGGGAQGDDAIWSHRSFTNFTLRGSAGPAGNLLGGSQIGETGLWVGDYTIQPENGGLGVFAHEYAHDLGLPDEYDTAGGENSTGFWTLMSSGSYLSDGTVDLGSRPGDMNAWDKLQLGWLNADTVSAGEVSTATLGPAEYNSELAQALIVTLPDRERTTELADPPEGDFAWWSDMGNDLDNSMSRAITVPAEDPVLELSLWYDIEEDWDYAYVAISVDDGASWEHLSASITTNLDPNSQNEGNGITGSSDGWLPVSFDLADYAGQSVLLQFRYVTDGAAVGKGLLADAIRVGSLFDGAESGADDWTLFGFSETAGVSIDATFHAYFAENRQYLSYDEGLAAGPYNFGFISTLPGWVEHYPYQNGLLISYWDDFHTNNNTSQHPGEGMLLPIDAHPDQLLRPDGLPWRARVQSYDATFGLEPTDPITLSIDGVESPQPSLPAVPVFDDLLDYYRPIPESAAQWSPWVGVAVPRTGTQIRVLETQEGGTILRVSVQPSVN
jgi:immune inhibitor A